MSRIFLSHSSADERATVGLAQWLSSNGWNELFLDVDPERGLIAGVRWQQALRRAADRCEAVVFAVSRPWARSKWCLAEFLLAKSLNKLIFGVVLDDVPVSELPVEMTSEWQLCFLTGQGPLETIRFIHRDQPVEVSFLAEGLQRLRAGLQLSGLNANYFPWPPAHDQSRSPYRGLEPLDFDDAAIFFGREVEILQGLDRLRGMRAAGDQGLFVVLGASGTGKSSFLRAGLLPRLARDQRHFHPLPVLRPERAPLTGDRGLASTLAKGLNALVATPINPGDVKATLADDPAGLHKLLLTIQSEAQSRLLSLPGAATPPSIVLPVDQAEELFTADVAHEAHRVLELIGGAVRAGIQENETPRAIWDPRTGTPVGEPLRGHDGAVTSVAYSPDGNRLVSASYEGTVRIWSLMANRNVIRTRAGGLGCWLHAAVSPDDKFIIAGSNCGGGQIFDGVSGKQIADLTADVNGEVASAAFNPTASHVAAAASRDGIRLFDVAEGRAIGPVMRGHTGRVTAIEFSADGKWLVTGGTDRTVRLWDAEAGRAMGAPMAGHQEPIVGVAFLASRTVISASGDGSIRRWNAETGRPLGEPWSGSRLGSLAQSPDGSRVVVGEFGILRVRDTANGQVLIDEMIGHSGLVAAVVFSRDGTRIVSGANDGMVRVWDSSTGQPIGAPWRGHAGIVNSVTFNGDETRIISGSADTTIRFWPAPKAWADELCAKLTTNLSRRQWRELVSADISYREQCPGLPVPPDDAAPQPRATRSDLSDPPHVPGRYGGLIPTAHASLLLGTHSLGRNLRLRRQP